jgi:hypothetical protein
MKKYVKPTIELVELKTEERISGSGINCDKNNNGATPLTPACTIPNNGINHGHGN